MRDVETLRLLLEHVRSADGGDTAIEAHLICAVVAPAGAFVTKGPIVGDLRVCVGRGAFTGADQFWKSWPLWSARRVTRHPSGARRLHSAALPGFWISSGLCSLSGHASTGPDYNGSAGDALRETWPEGRFDKGFHADLGPGDGPHREAYVILDVTLQVLIAQAQEAPHGLR